MVSQSSRALADYAHHAHLARNPLQQACHMRDSGMYCAEWHAMQDIHHGDVLA